MNFLLCAEEGGSNLSSILMIGLLIVFLVVYLVLGFVNRKKQTEQAMKMMNDLKKGDKIVTNAGIYGEIVSMRETDMGRVVLIKTGDENNFSFIELNSSVILGKDNKKELVLDAEGNVIDDYKKDEVAEQLLKEKVEIEKETKKEEKEKLEKDGNGQKKERKTSKGQD